MTDDINIIYQYHIPLSCFNIQTHSSYINNSLELEYFITLNVLYMLAFYENIGLDLGLDDVEKNTINWTVHLPNQQKGKEVFHMLPVSLLCCLEICSM